MHTPFLRLVWKEYRSQRNLWLALFAFAMCLALWMSTFLNVIDRPFPAMIVLSAGIGLICATCSLLYLFAGEEDNGTAPWLRNLPMKTSTLLLAKLTTTVLATLLYMVVSGISVCVIYGVACLIKGESVFEGLQLRWLNSDEAAGLMKLAATTTAFLSLTLFWSLYCRKVIAAICGCGVSLVVFAALYGSRSPFHRGAISEPIVWWSMTLSLLAVGLSIYILPGWHRGIRRLDAVSLFQRFQHRPSVRIRESGTGFLATRLQTWAMRSPVSSRTFRVLLWQQLRSAIPFAFVCLLLLIPAVWMRYTNFFPAPLSLLSLIVLECGLRTFRNDQRNRSGLFWAHRGVSSTTVLLTRHAVWLTVLFSLAAAFVLADGLMGRQSARDQASLAEMLNEINILFSRLEWGENGSTPIVFLLPTVFAWLLGGYAIGHLSSVWIRKAFVSAFVAIFAYVGYTIFLGYVYLSDVPGWLTAWPLIVSLLLLPVITRRYWMDHQTESWKYDFRHILLVAVPVFCMWPMYNVGRLVLPLELFRLSNEIPPELVSGVETHANERLPRNVAAWNSSWESLARITNAVPVELNAAKSPSAITTRSSQHQKAAILEVDKIRETLGEDMAFRLPEQYQKPWSVSFAEPVTTVLIQEARRLRDAGDFGEAIQRLAQAKYILCYLRSEASDAGLEQATNIWQRVVDQHLHELVSDDAVTAENLRNMQAQLVAIAYRLRLGTPMREYLRAAWFELHGANVDPENLAELPRTFKSMSWVERMRFLSVINAASAIENGDDYRHARLERLARRAMATVDNEMRRYGDSVTDWAQYSSGKYSFVPGDWSAAIDSTRATQLIVALQIYRRKNGQFPATLFETEMRENNEYVLIDLRSGGTFPYSGDGLGMDFRLYSFRLSPPIAIQVDGRQPILWKNGIRGPNLHGPHDDEDDDEIPDDNDLPLNPKRVLYIDGAREMVIPPDRLWGDPVKELDSETADVLHRDVAE